MGRKRREGINMAVNEPKYQAYIKLGTSTLDSTVEIVVSAEADTKDECMDLYNHVYATIKDSIKFENIKREVKKAE